MSSDYNCPMARNVERLENQNFKKENSNCTNLLFSFLKFCFSNLFCFTLLLWKSAVCTDTVFYGSVHFWVECSVPFNCGFNSGSCMSRSVKGDTLICMVYAIKLIPWKVSCTVCFASWVCLTQPCLASPETVSFCLTVLSLELKVCKTM